MNEQHDWIRHDLGGLGCCPDAAKTPFASGRESRNTGNSGAAPGLYRRPGRAGEAFRAARLVPLAMAAGDRPIPSVAPVPLPARNTTRRGESRARLVRPLFPGDLHLLFQ